MTHTIEPAASGRSKCRGCASTISKGDLRFGERLPNPFADGDMTIWFHLTCAAYKRPESIGEVLEETTNWPDGEAAEKSRLKQTLSFAQTYHRVARINGCERAPSARARCRHCKETIAKDAWRIPLVIFEEGMFNASGNIHAACSTAYFETSDIIHIIEHFAPGLSNFELAEIDALIQDTANS